MNVKKVHDVFGGEKANVQPIYPVFFVDLGLEKADKRGVSLPKAQGEIASSLRSADAKKEKVIDKSNPMMAVVYSRGIQDTFCFDKDIIDELKNFAYKILSNSNDFESKVLRGFSTSEIDSKNTEPSDNDNLNKSSSNDDGAKRSLSDDDYGDATPLKKIRS